MSVSPTEFANDFNVFPADGTLGEVIGEAAGPTVILLAAMHGNEPAGVPAIRAVLGGLARVGLKRGRVAGRVGNRAALARGVRHQGLDLNRLWFQGLGQPFAGPDEDERQALADWLAPRLAEPAVLIDLHTTSAGGPPFAMAVDTPGNRELGAALPFPLVFGLLEQVPGTVAEWATRLGHRSLAIEAGQHLDPRAEAVHEAALWHLLGALGCTDQGPPPIADLPGPACLSLVYRHAITDDDAFVMEPGFLGLQPVSCGDLLARDRRGEVRAGFDGQILMPLYQPGGREGFFIVRSQP